MATPPILTRTILINTAVSDAIRTLEGDRLDIAVIASGWTTAELRVQGSADGTNWFTILDPEGVAYGLAAGPTTSWATIYGVPNFPFIRFRSQTSGSATNQAAARTLTVRVTPSEQHTIINNVTVEAP